MNKQLLRKAILAVVGTAFVVSAITYPVVGSTLKNLRPIAVNTAIAEAKPADQNVVDVEEKANQLDQQLLDATDGESGKAITFSGESTVLTKEEWEAVTDKVQDKEEGWPGYTQKNADPTIVAKAKARALGLDPQKDKFMHIGSKDEKNEILVSHGEQKYILTFAFVPGKGWILISSREVIDTVKPSEKVVTGTVKLNMQKLADLQKLADYGHQTWRLDPLQVAKYQGTAFGFDRLTDSFELMPSILLLRERGEAAVLVKHGKKHYRINLIQPFGNTKDKIWTIASVKEVKSDGSDVTKPNVPVSGTIYRNHLLDNWAWSKGTLPKNMAFTAVVDLDYQRKKDNRFRSDIWDVISSYDHKNNVLLLATLGAMPTGGYDIGIKNVSVRGREVTVHVVFKSPAYGNSVTMATTYPFDVVLIPKNKLPLDKEVTFTFIDPKGNLLTTVKATVK